MLFEVAVDVEETLFLSLASCGVIDDGYQSPYVRGLGLERGCCRTAQMTLYLPHPPFIRLCFRCLGTAVSKKREREAPLTSDNPRFQVFNLPNALRMSSCLLCSLSWEVLKQLTSE